ncbi:M24 family metallopeptidase [Edaphobacter bradus]|uniref:M24 family metallopeptidase n=1 Tax=Edaphobacter bradus TaxID=2259016 RepID=UPI0021E09195|nr:M24 family metallopeptidase [Edaphobacter bradus]
MKNKSPSFLENEKELFPVRERATERAQKHQRIQEFLEVHLLDGLIVSRHENIAWATAGVVEIRVAVTRETGPGSLLFTRNGDTYYLTSNNEAPRLAKEEFADLGYQALIEPWYASNPTESARRIVSEGRLGGDDASLGLPVVSMKGLRSLLTEGEIARYRWLGENVADAVTNSLFLLHPGMSEATMQALVAQQLLAKRILPSVLLIAVDARIRNYRHAVARDGVLDRFGMLNICARRWGLVASITRYVHFGAMPAELEEKFEAAEAVNAALMDATREGATAGELFEVARERYTAQGYSGEEQMHHQGGAIGYWEREWIARPGGTEHVLNPQLMAWNPNLQGAKVEDTVVFRDGELEVLTSTPRLPVVETRCNGNVYRSAGVLLA